jgi:hypothetical protein
VTSHRWFFFKFSKLKKSMSVNFDFFFYFLQKWTLMYKESIFMIDRKNLSWFSQNVFLKWPLFVKKNINNKKRHFKKNILRKLRNMFSLDHKNWFYYVKLISAKKKKNRNWLSCFFSTLKIWKKKIIDDWSP